MLDRQAEVEMKLPGRFKVSPQTAVFLIRSSARHDAVTGVTMVAGLAGALVSSVATAANDNPGPAEFVPLDEPAARMTLAELQLAQ